MRGDICFFGHKKVGKTSIIKVVFTKVHPLDTQFIDATTDIQCQEISFKGFYKFNLIDIPGSQDTADIQEGEMEYIRRCGVAIYVVDYKAENLQDSSDHFKKFYRLIKEVNPEALINIFFHKCDEANPEDASSELWKVFIENIKEDLSQSNAGNDAANLKYFLTSIYDHTIYEAMSKIIYKVVGFHIKCLKKMMNDLSTACQFDKVYLFDVISKLFFLRDFVPFDAENFAICADILDVFVDFSVIYGGDKNNKAEIITEDEAHPPSMLIKLSDNRMLYLQELVQHVTIVCYLKEEYLERKNIIDYNIDIFRKTFKKIRDQLNLENSAEKSNKMKSVSQPGPKGTTPQ